MSWIDKERLTVVVGHFGSGKTEFSVNLAFGLAELGHRTALADLDVAAPYFRSRECQKILLEQGIQLICSSNECADADVPSLAPEVASLFDTPDLYGILDIGGDAAGARVLARYQKRLSALKARVFCVVNGNRPLTNTCEKAENYIRSIEASSGLPITGLINNTHFLDRTTKQDILYGACLTAKLSEKTGIPVVCHMAEAGRFLLEEVCPVFPVRIFMKKPWE